MTRPLVSAALLGVLALGVTACTSFESGKTMSSPIAPSVTGGSSAGTLVGTWDSQAGFALPSASTCTNFEWQISTQSSSAVAGTFAATCAGGVGISATASGSLNSTTAVALSISGVALIGGVPACTFTLNGLGTIANDDTLTIPYTGTTCLGPVHGTETLRRRTSSPPPPAPLPDPTPAPPPPGGGGAAADAIDLNQATIVNSPRDLASWPISTAITAIDIQARGVHVEFSRRDGPGRWPDVFPPGWGEPLQYTLGMALNIGGRWYASSVVEYWYGLDYSGGPPSQYATNWFYDPIRWAPMTYHQPAVGEMIGFFVVEGDTRNNLLGTTSPLRERSNVVLVPMPSDGGGYHTFGFR
jgi:hypothetical protein